MAIKTKKISDLSVITGGNDCYLIGQTGSITGKISYQSIMEDVDNRITNALVGFSPQVVSVSEEMISSVSHEDFVSLQNMIEKTKGDVTSISKSVKSIEKNYKTFCTSTTDSILELQQQVSDLIVANEKLTNFVHALQADGYLTLANIKKAAVENCPCEQPHVEQQTPTE